MKTKSILSIAAFSTAFILSAAFAALFVDKNDSQTEYFFPFKTETVVTTYETDEPLGVDIAAAAKIDSLLQKDDDNGFALTAKIYALTNADGRLPLASTNVFVSYADATAAYAAASGKLDQDGLPPEFKAAWSRHMKAWRNYSVFLAAMKNPSVRKDLEKNDFDDLDNEFNEEIRASWVNVLQIADASGVDIDTYLTNSES